jgi:thiol-disulfide isomerase/thioredoxin
MKRKRQFCAVLAFSIGLGLILSGQAIGQGQRQQPPEYKEVVAASRIMDAPARLKEFERIKSVYPNSEMMEIIDRYILTTKIEMAGTLDAILALQKDFLAKGKGPARLQNPFMAADQILQHPKLKTFDKAKVTTVVLQYKEEALKAAGETETYQGIPQDRQKYLKSYFVTGFEIPVAQAYLNADDAAKAMAALDAYKKDGGALDSQYFYTLAGIYDKMDKAKEAHEAYLTAAVENYEDAAARAKALYIKINGKADGFEAQLEAKLKSIPYHPETFKVSAEWKGKTVLAELFTGSECPPCVGTDLGFDGLIEAYPAKYLAVLEYHLPIPRPDPMMNPAAKIRQDYYGVNSTPTVVIDGDKKMIGGGNRGMAEGKFKEYKTEIDARVNDAPVVSLKAKATRASDTVNVEYEIDKPAPGAEYRIVLVQAEEKYKGSNGLQFHKLVVRDLVTVDPAAATKQAAFDLAKSEQATAEYLTEFERTYTRIQNFKFAERHHKIDRQGLKVVFFAQEKESKKVLNAVVIDVK